MHLSLVLACRPLCSRRPSLCPWACALYEGHPWGKAKNDKIDAQKIAVLLRGGMRPQAYGSPEEMRATRDLLRRRVHLTRKRAELLAHIHHTNSQDNLPEIGKQSASKANRDGVAERFPDPAGQKSVEVDLALLDGDAQ